MKLFELDLGRCVRWAASRHRWRSGHRRRATCAASPLRLDIGLLARRERRRNRGRGMLPQRQGLGLGDRGLVGPRRHGAASPARNDGRPRGSFRRFDAGWNASAGFGRRGTVGRNRRARRGSRAAGAFVHGPNDPRPRFASEAGRIPDSTQFCRISPLRRCRGGS